MKMLLYALSLIGLICLTALAAREPTLTNIAGMVAMLGTHLAAFWNASKSSTEADQLLFHQFLALLPSTSTAITFLKGHDFSGVHDREHLDPLLDYERHWGSPEHTFRDRTMRRLQNQFMNAISALMSHLGQHATPHPMRPYSYRIVEPNVPNDEANRAADAANELAAVAYRAHQALITRGIELNLDTKQSHGNEGPANA